MDLVGASLACYMTLPCFVTDQDLSVSSFVDNYSCAENPGRQGTHIILVDTWQGGQNAMHNV